MEQIVNIPTSDLTESPFNYRSIFRETSLQELATDIKTQGRVLSPLLVRPLATADGFEIVFGHRRFRAAKIAGFSIVPCMVRSMTDEEVKRAQISENLAREDVHAIEEAEGFQALMQDHRITADELAAQTGKSRSYIYGRLVLLKACKQVREACLQGAIGSETALLLARLRTDKLQTKALAYIASAYIDMGDGGKKSFRQIRALLQEKFALDLKTAIFDPDDMVLLNDANACTICPKRSGNAPEFSDVVETGISRHTHTNSGSADICTDPDCFAAKKKAHLLKQAAALESKGKTVIDGNKALSAVSAQGQVKGAYIALKDVKAELKNAKTAIATVMIQDQRTGKMHEAVEVKALKDAGVKVKDPFKARNFEAQQQQRQEDARKKNEDRAVELTQKNTAMLQIVRTFVQRSERTAYDLMLVARTCLAGVQHNNRSFLASVWDCNSYENLSRKLGSMPVEQLTRLMMDCALVDDVRINPYSLGEKPETLLAYAKHYGLDLAEPTPSTPDPAAQAPEDRPSEELAEA